jgi:hypothetical protein
MVHEDYLQQALHFAMCLVFDAVDIQVLYSTWRPVGTIQDCLGPECEIRELPLKSC